MRLSALRLTLERGGDRLAADITATAQVTEVSVAQGWASGTATVAASHLAVRIGPAVVESTAVIHVALGRGTWGGGAWDLSGSSAVVRDAFARSAGTGKTFLVVPLVSVVAPRVSLGPSGANGHVALDIPVARLPDLGGLRELLPPATGLAIEGGMGRATLHTDLDLGSRSLRGAATLVARGVRARAGNTELFGDLDLTVRAQHGGGAATETDISNSSLAITHGGTGTEALPNSPWWGNLMLRRGTVRALGGFRVDAVAHIEAMDASPATELFSQNAGIPPWVANVFRMPALHADAEVRATPSSFEVRSLLARGGTTSLRAEYSRHAGHEHGGLLMDLGWIGLGYGFGDGATGLVLVDAASWSGEQ